MARRRKTDITLWDYARLQRELLSRPAFVLRHFVRCQIEALDQLAMFREIRQSDPDAALRIEAVAVSMGIPLQLTAQASLQGEA